MGLEFLFLPCCYPCIISSIAVCLMGLVPTGLFIDLKDSTPSLVPTFKSILLLPGGAAGYVGLGERFGELHQYGDLPRGEAIWAEAKGCCAAPVMLCSHFPTP